MTTTPKLGLQLLLQNDTNSVDSLNLNLERLDVLANLVLKDLDLTAQPSAPALGDAYYIPSGGGTGASWSGQSDVIAFYIDNGEDPAGWVFLDPFEGMTAYVEDISSTRVYNGTTWIGSQAQAFINQIHPFTPVTASASDRYGLLYADVDVSFSEFIITNGPSGANAPTDKVLVEVGYSTNVNSGTATLVIDDNETDNGSGVLSGWETPDTTINTAGCYAYQPGAVTVPAGNWIWYRINTVTGTVPVLTLHATYVK